MMAYTVAQFTRLLNQSDEYRLYEEILPVSTLISNQTRGEEITKLWISFGSAKRTSSTWEQIESIIAVVSRLFRDQILSHKAMVFPSYFLSF